MVTADVERDIRLPWHHFIGDAKVLRELVDVFRRFKWDGIKRDLDRDFNWNIPDGLEPHWVTPGKAVYWQEMIVREQTRSEAMPSQVLSVEFVSSGWQPTGPLPASNASQIARYLEKGFRLRPPVEGVSQEVLKEAAVPAEALQEEPEGPSEYIYACDRHGIDHKEFKTWKAYIQHCAYFREPLDQPIPESVLENMKGFVYYCALHNRGFKNEHAANQHMRAEMQRRVGSLHPTLQQMEVHGD
jgi:hypothetical protein